MELSSEKTNQEKNAFANQNPEKRVKYGLSSTFNLLNTMVGAGFLSLPYAIHSSGFLFAIIATVVMTISSAISCRAITRAAEITGKKSMPDIAKELGGINLGILALSCLLISNIGVLIVYHVIIGEGLSDLFTVWFPNQPIFHNIYFILSFWAFFLLLPLSLLRNLDPLKYSSMVALCLIVYIFFVVLFDGNERYENLSFFPPNLGYFFRDLDVIAMAFGCSFQVPQLYSELKEQYNSNTQSVESTDRPVAYKDTTQLLTTQPSDKTPSIQSNTANNSPQTQNMFEYYIGYAHSVVFILYLLVGLMGSSRFQDKTSENILENLDTSHLSVTIAKLAMIAVITTSFPLLNYGARQSLDCLLRIIMGDGGYYALGNINNINMINNDGIELIDKNKDDNNEDIELVQIDKNKDTNDDDKDDKTKKNVIKNLVNFNMNMTINHNEIGCFRHTTETVFLLSLTLVIAFLIPHPGHIFALSGSIGGMFSTFFFPSYFQILLYKRANIHWKNRKMYLFYGVCALAAILAAIAFPFALITVISEFGMNEWENREINRTNPVP